jgi:NAD+ diphosphatase
MILHTGFQFCPRCGGRNIRDHGGKSILCGDCGFLYFHNTASAVAGIIETAGGIVLVGRRVEPAVGMLDFPGGFVDYGESFESALKREVKEELNLDVSDLCYFGSFFNTYAYKGVTYYTSDAVFLCGAEITSALTPNGEIAEVVIVPPENVDASLLAFESARAALTKYREHLKVKRP